MRRKRALQLDQRVSAMSAMDVSWQALASGLTVFVGYNAFNAWLVWHYYQVCRLSGYQYAVASTAASCAHTPSSVVHGIGWR